MAAFSDIFKNFGENVVIRFLTGRNFAELVQELTDLREEAGPDKTGTAFLKNGLKVSTHRDSFRRHILYLQEMNEDAVEIKIPGDLSNRTIVANTNLLLPVKVLIRYGKEAERSLYIPIMYIRSPIRKASSLQRKSHCRTINRGDL